jgi:hypothetical protein
MRFLTAPLLAVLAALLLAACDVGATTPSEQPIPTLQSSGDATASAAASDDDDDGSAMSCEDAFAALDIAEISSMSDLESIGDELDETIEACGSVEDWQSAIADVVPELDTSEAEQFLRDRCAEADDEIAESRICQEVAM